MSDVLPVIIIGSGPAGLTAALYTARANLKPLVIEGLEAGGQLMITTMVENWPGYRDGIMGPDLIQEMRVQAERFGARIIQGHVESVDLSTRPFRVSLSDKEYRAETLIIATGASAQWLGCRRRRSWSVAASRVARLVTARFSRTGRLWSSAAATPPWRRRCS